MSAADVQALLDAAPEEADLKPKKAAEEQPRQTQTANANAVTVTVITTAATVTTPTATKMVAVEEHQVVLLVAA